MRKPRTGSASPRRVQERLKTHPAFQVAGSIRDGSTLRFKEAAIEELARELGAGSNPENPVALGIPRRGEKSGDSLKFGDEADVFSLASDEPKSDPKNKPAAKTGSDRRRATRCREAQVRQDRQEHGRRGCPDRGNLHRLQRTGQRGHQGRQFLQTLRAKSTGKLTSDSGKSLANPGPADSSEFELSLDADSDDFELQMSGDSSGDEVDLGSLPKGGGSGIARGSKSGINLRDPADSGISLEKGKAKDAAPPAGGKVESDSDLDFELTLDSSSAVHAAKLGGAKGKKADDSDSEFELTLDDSSGSPGLEEESAGSSSAADKGDIFETDFEIPPMGDSDSGSEAVALETSDTDLEKSDFDVALDDSGEAPPESGSEVVLLEEEEAPKAKGKGKAKKAAEADEGDVDLAEVEEEADESSVSKALKGAKARRDEDEEEEAAAVPAGVYRPVPWGPWPTVFLLPAFIFMLMGAIMGYELLQTMWGYQQPRKPAAPLVQGIASTLEMEPAGQ